MLHILAPCEITTIEKNSDAFYKEDLVVCITPLENMQHLSNLNKHLSPKVDKIYCIIDPEHPELSHSMPTEITPISYEKFVKLCEQNTSIQTWY